MTGFCKSGDEPPGSIKCSRRVSSSVRTLLHGVSLLAVWLDRSHFSTLPHKWHDFLGRKFIEREKCASIFSLSSV